MKIPFIKTQSLSPENKYNFFIMQLISLFYCILTREKGKDFIYVMS